MNAPNEDDGGTGDGPQSRPLRILVISQHYWPESFRINSFVEELRKAGAEVAVLTAQPNYPDGTVFQGYRWYKAGTERHPAGYDIYRVPIIPRGRAKAMRLTLNYLSFIAAGWIFGPVLLRGRGFDVLFVYGTSPILQAFVGLPLKWLKRAKLVIWVQDLWPEVLAATGFVANRRVLATVQRLVSWLYRRADLILGQSPAFVEAIRPHAGQVPVRFLPNPGEPSASEGSAPDIAVRQGFNVIFAGNLGRAQALETVVDAAERLQMHRDVRITMFGSGAMEPFVSRAIAERKLDNLSLGGRLPPEMMPSAYARADALLLTLVDDDMVARTIPSKLQSYLAAGIPIVAAAGGEAARIVTAAGAGITCPPGDSEALAAAISALKDLRSEERKAMGAAGRAYYLANFDGDHLARRLIDQLGVLAEGPASSGSVLQ